VSKCTIAPAEGVLVQTSNLWNTNSTLITGIGRAATATVVVDPGWFPDEIAELQAAAAATWPGHATHVLFTHGDFDHVVAWEDFPGAQIIASPKAAQRKAADVEKQVSDLDARRETVRPHPYRYPPANAFTSPSSLDVGGETILFFDAPGHQADGLFTVLPERHILIAGDYLSDEEFPFIYHSMPDYRATLLLARDLCKRYEILEEVPGHGQVATTPDEIEYRISTDLDYLDRLDAGVKAAKAEGLDFEEAAKRLASFTFRGEPITGLVKAHIDNVRMLYGAAREWEPS
jgi:glyoxylase-like metal-dependent hydrolase (beta-lactamase superfamily II)